MNRFLIRFFILVASFFALSPQAKASHFAAGDIKVEFVGLDSLDLRYKVTVTVFYDCSGAPPYATIELFWQSTSAGVNNSLLIPFDPAQNLTLSQLCPAFASQSSCVNPSGNKPGFFKRVYSTVLTLTRRPDWNFWIDEFARNGAITNLTNPSAFVVYSRYNNLIRYNNNTVNFTIDPVPYYCINQPSQFLNSPYDADGDSIVVTPNLSYGASGTGITIPNFTNQNLFAYNYEPGYSVTNPVGASATNPYYVNPASGTATFTPTIDGAMVVAFEAADYDRCTKQLLSTVSRDVQIIINPAAQCNIQIPSIDSIPSNLVNCTLDTAGGLKNINVCPGQTISFQIQASAATITNLVTLNSNAAQSCPGSSFVVNNQYTLNPTATFTWTPTVNDIGDKIFLGIAADSTCTGGQIFVVKNTMYVIIRVQASVDAGPDGFVCPEGGKPWQLNAGGPLNVPYIWTDVSGGAPNGLDNANIKNPTALPTSDACYVVEIGSCIPTCKSKDTVCVSQKSNSSVTIVPGSPIIVCRPDYIQLTANVVGDKPIANLPCGTANPVTCPTEDSTVVVFPGGSILPNLAGTPFYSPFCGDLRSAKSQYLYRQNEMRSYGMYSGTINSLSFLVQAPTATTYSNFSISLKCTNRTNMDPLYAPLENTGMTTVFTSATPITPTVGWNKFVFNTPYTWDTTQNLLVEVCYSNATAGTTSIISNVSTNFISTQRKSTTTGTTNYCTTPLATGTTDAFLYRPLIKFNSCRAPETDFPYTWKPGFFLSDSTVTAPFAYIADDIKYTITSVDRDGCIFRDSVDIFVPEHNFTRFPIDTSICIGDTIILRGFGANTYQWFESDAFNPPTTLSCTNCQDPYAFPTVDTKYYVVGYPADSYTDSVKCADTLAIQVRIRPLPTVDILMATDTTVKYGSTILVSATSSASRFLWRPVASVSNPNLLVTTLKPTKNTTYTLVAIDKYGCKNEDSIRVNIDYRDHLMVPSAFSPNGDGRNDDFKVANLTFQRVIEFRVLNRWGQEVYYAANNKPWDGTWKGVPQDMGTYSYFIKVAYPDGIIETYKGEVTLVR
jgi:gliding motility-associated-like protein